MVDRSDPEFFNPCEHVRVQSPYVNAAKCACSWVGGNFDMHLAAMQATYDVMGVYKIEEEP